MCKAIQDIRQDAYDQGKQEERNNTLREKERADAAENHAKAEKNRADAAEQELARLQEELRRLRSQLAGSN